MHPVLDVGEVTHRYGKTVALDDAALSVAPGECVALLGPNGAGKTTLVDLVTGLLPRQAGRIVVTGGDPARASTRRHLGVVQQQVGLPRTLTTFDVVRGAAARAGVSPLRVGPTLVEVGLGNLRRRRAARLSGGQKQRLKLAMALIASPALLVLDEPTTGLDATSRRDFWSTLAIRRDRGTGVLLTTHQLDEAAAVADRVVVLAQGRVVAEDTPDELTSRLADREVSAVTTVDPEAVAALDGVLTVDVDADRLRVSTTSPEQLVAALLQWDPALRDLRVEAAGLEHAVLRIVDHAHTGTDAPADTPDRPTVEQEV